MPEATVRLEWPESLHTKSKQSDLYSITSVPGKPLGRFGAPTSQLTLCACRRFPAPRTPATRPWEKFQLACMREIEKQARATWKPPKTQPRIYVTAAYDYYRIAIPPNEVSPGLDDHDERDMVAHGSYHQDRARSARGRGHYEERPTRREEPESQSYSHSHARRQGEHQREPEGAPRYRGGSADPEATYIPSRHETPAFVRRELANQQRDRWEALASQGSLVSEVNYSRYLGSRPAEASGSGNPLNDNGKRGRTMSSGDSTRALDGGRDRRDPHGGYPGGGARGMHTHARDSRRDDGRDPSRGGSRRGRR